MLNATPKDILESTNPHLVTAVRDWKIGLITWEQALMNAALGLSREVNHLKSNMGPSPLLAAASVSLEIEKTVSSPPLARIEYFKKYGHWPEGRPTFDPAARL